MKKSFMLTFVFAAFSFAGVFAQTVSPSATPTGKPKQERKADKTTPSSARPDAKTPSTQSTDPVKVEKGEKAQKGEKVKKGKANGHFKDQKGKGKAKGHKKGQQAPEAESHEGHNHGKGGESHGQSKRTENNGKAPIEAPKPGSTQKQNRKN